MIVAVIIAGGVGTRMGADIPKQFIQVNGKPVLFYTLEAFESHPMVDAIEVVCLEGWEKVVAAYRDKFKIEKLRWVITGGATGQESIRNGVFGLEGVCASDDLIVIHDGIRPLVEAAVLDDVISTALRFGNAVSSTPWNEQIFLVDPINPDSTTRFIPRETVRRVATPQAYRFDLLDAAYHDAFSRGVGISPSSYANTMMVELGHRLYFAAGSDRNVKLTTPADIDVFKTFLNGRQSGVFSEAISKH